MNVTVVCYGAMREYLPDESVGNTTVIELADGATVGDVADALGAPRGLVHAALIGEDPVDLGSSLNDGDRLTLMPHFAGGRT